MPWTWREEEKEKKEKEKEKEAKEERDGGVKHNCHSNNPQFVFQNSKYLIMKPDSLKDAFHTCNGGVQKSTKEEQTATVLLNPTRLFV